MLRVDVIAVTQGYVEVPHVGQYEFAGRGLGEEDTLAEVAVHILADFLNYIVTHEGIQVDEFLPSAAGIGIEGVLNILHIGLEIGDLLGSGFFGILEHEGDKPAGGFEADLLVLGGVHLQVHIPVLHVDIHLLLGHFLMLAEHVAALIAVVDIELHRAHVRGPWHSAEAGNLHGHNVAQQRFVGVVGKQHPVFVALHSQQLGVILKLDAIGLLCHIPGGVAPAAHLHIALEKDGIGIHSVWVFHTDGAGDIGVCRLGLGSALGDEPAIIRGIDGDAHRGEMLDLFPGQVVAGFGLLLRGVKRIRLSGSVCGGDSLLSFGIQGLHEAILLPAAQRQKEDDHDGEKSFYCFIHARLKR